MILFNNFDSLLNLGGGNYVHFVFLVGAYYPNFSATGKCIGNVADELVKNHDITIICQKSNLHEPDEETYNNQKVLRIQILDKIKREKVIEQIKSLQGIKKSYKQLHLRIIKFQQVLKLLISRTSIREQIVNAYLSKLSEIDKNIDVIVPATMPFESVLAGYKFIIENNFRGVFLPFLFDFFTESKTLHRFSINRLVKWKAHIRLEKEVFSKAARVIAIYTLREFYNKRIPEIRQMVYIEHPLIIPRDAASLSYSKCIRLAYIGGLNKKYVEADYLLKLISRSNIKARVEFYTFGNGIGIIDKFAKKDPLRIINKGRVEKETAENKIAENDILISLSERNGIQLSSKIYDYISYGKPIINFYCNDDDANCQVLEKYPLALCLKEDNKLLSQNAKAFEEFCLENSGKSVAWDRVAELYPDALPENTKKLIEEIVLNSK